jgi:hypothetical protein
MSPHERTHLASAGNEIEWRVIAWRSDGHALSY